MPTLRLSTRSLLQNPHRASRQPLPDVVDHLRVVDLVALLADIAEVRGEHDIVELAEGMIERQRLDVERIKPRAGELAAAERGKQRRLVDDRPARRVDQE